MALCRFRCSNKLAKATRGGRDMNPPDLWIHGGGGGGNVADGGERSRDDEQDSTVGRRSLAARTDRLAGPSRLSVAVLLCSIIVF